MTNPGMDADIYDAFIEQLQRYVRERLIPAEDQLEELGRSIRVKAQLAGHDAGYAAGHAEGYAAGKAEGLEAGTKEGYDLGFQAGHEEGRDLSKNETEQLSALASACAQSLSTVESDVGQALMRAMDEPHPPKTNRQSSAANNALILFPFK